MRMLGERACDRLLERIATPGLPPQVELLPTELVLRESCGCPPGTLIRRPIGRGTLVLAAGGGDADGDGVPSRPFSPDPKLHGS